MTNEQIVLGERIRLMEQGILQSIGKVEVIADDGSVEVKDYPEPIHTFNGWKALGYTVKKGEHAIARFAIWSPSKKKKADDEDADDEAISMYLRNAYWFKQEQVEEVK